MENIKYFKSKYFNNKKFIYGFFSRKGGYSRKHLKSLNCSMSNKDSKNNVIKNRKKSQKALGLEKTKLKFINQIHSNKIYMINKKNINKPLVGDAIITSTSDISLAILTADCAPIFLIDIKNNLICAIHSGWRGSYNDIVHKTINKIKQTKKNNRLIAIIGPCLDQKNFEVDKKFYYKFLKKNLLYKKFFIKKSIKYLFDMRGLLRYQLLKYGVKKVINIKLNTYSKKTLFFSHRRSKQNNQNYSGRMINILGFSQKI
ncbi:MAG: Laccase domain protein YfiH [Alphaproteobacteria bacterium MarineAlpha5_Bin9]|nr:MAG: Laccase domain protein YfiH [Alphaproteobacteria bacterium MarineAlpha5_Bin9]|tara:strand:+ start:6355 stop:7128 length:774 start_codon:yes stop_codon:yes gene_type:complete